ncbi:MAG: hypothetical protein COT73_01110 [Bdellovibrio sp. CG10_big_fil_rev_8_21_14_0_10_47_8]|nr:MAG: hypothetical protein COT73_01110 [Bdellovibrio sp. CG10_big_fil_rev_8_21_14_0_10_47_8]
MMPHRILILILSLFACTSFAEQTPSTAATADKPAVEKKSETPTVDYGGVTSKTNYLICKNKDVVRTVRVLKKDEGGCKTMYTKEGVDKVVSESTYSAGCWKILGNIKINLEKASWKCKDISDSRVSSSEE